MAVAVSGNGLMPIRAERGLSCADLSTVGQQTSHHITFKGDES